MMTSSRLSLDLIKKFMTPMLAIVMVLILYWLDPGGISQMGLSISNFESKTKHPSNIVILDIDEESQKKYGRWPYDRRDLAAIINKIKSQGASAVVLDLPMQDPDRARGDEDLAKALVGKGVILIQTATNDTQLSSYVPKAFAGMDDRALNSLERYNGVVFPLPKLMQSSSGVGTIGFLENKSLLVKYPLLVSVNQIPHASPLLEIIRYITHETQYSFQITNQGVKVSLGQFLHISADEKSKIHIKYDDRFEIIKLSQQKFEDTKNKIVIIGSSIPNVNTVLDTPHGPRHSHMIHAYALQTVLDGAPPVRTKFVIFLELLVGIISGLVLWVFWQKPDHMINTFKLILILGITAGAPFVILSNLNILLDPLWPSILVLTPLVAGLFIKYKHTMRCYLCRWICKGISDEIKDA